jgi:endonuclease/exonuclease/phosphatase family metal-dependent hydrolase
MTKTHPSPGAFRVMTLNLRFGLAKDGPNAWRHRRSAYPSLFSQYPADIYCFQEANDFQLEDLASWLPGHAPIGIRQAAPPFWQHNPIFVPRSWQIRHWERIYLSVTPELPSRQRASKWPRQCTIGHFRRDRDEIICLNTHFDFAPETQRADARAVAKRLKSLPASVPCVIAGDFNAAPGGRCHQSMTGKGWVPGRRFTSAFGTDPPGTFHGFTGENSGKHIDWMLVDGNVRVMSANAVTRSFNGIYPSDHFPLVAALIFTADDSDCARESSAR